MKNFIQTLYLIITVILNILSFMLILCITVFSICNELPETELLKCIIGIITCMFLYQKTYKSLNRINKNEL